MSLMKILLDFLPTKIFYLTHWLDNLLETLSPGNIINVPEGKTYLSELEGTSKEL